MDALEIQATGAGSFIKIKRRLGSNSTENEGTDTLPARPKLFKYNKCKLLHKWDDAPNPIVGKEIAIRTLEYKDSRISELQHKVDSLMKQVEGLTEQVKSLSKRTKNLTAENQCFLEILVLRDYSYTRGAQDQSLGTSNLTLVEGSGDETNPTQNLNYLWLLDHSRSFYNALHKGQ
ncbi:hypothetical protein TWF569_008658 [Orbilia oligospora]|nr:hypothetical protein TWF569_008658 [Orbilia oligospora]